MKAKKARPEPKPARSPRVTRPGCHSQQLTPPFSEHPANVVDALKCSYVSKPHQQAEQRDDQAVNETPPPAHRTIPARPREAAERPAHRRRDFCRNGSPARLAGSPVRSGSRAPAWLRSD